MFEYNLFYTADYHFRMNYSTHNSSENRFDPVVLDPGGKADKAVALGN